MISTRPVKLDQIALSYLASTLSCCKKGVAPPPPHHTQNRRVAGAPAPGLAIFFSLSPGFRPGLHHAALPVSDVVFIVILTHFMDNPGCGCCGKWPNAFRLLLPLLVRPVNFN